MIPTSEAARILGISQRRVVELIHLGALKAHKLGGVWLVDETSIENRAKTARKSGRPIRGHGRNDVRFILMNRTHEIAEVCYNLARHEFSSVGELSDLRRAPIGLAQGGTIRVRNLNNWWRERGIPQQRENLAQLLRSLGAQLPEELLYRNLGLSLSDQYWINPIDAPLAWEEVNFFNNSFSVVAKATALNADDAELLAHPDNTSDGNLEKHWVERGGKRFLQKGANRNGQEPYNEAVATALHKRLLGREEYVAYRLIRSHGQTLCECANFLSDQEEYVPSSYVAKHQEQPAAVSDYQHYVDCCKRLGADGVEQALARMIVCDDIIANHNRHWRNFGLIRNVETLECRPAPLFDSGSSLWCNVDLADLQAGNFAFESKAFENAPSRQLLLVEDFSWFDEKALVGFVDEAIDILAQNEWIASRLPYIQNALSHRVERMIAITE